MEIYNQKGTAVPKSVKAICLTFFVLISSSVHAQLQDHRRDFRIGLKAGINSADVYDEAGDAFVAKRKLGYVLGGFITLPVDDLIGFQPEILVSQKGFDASGMYFGESYNFTRTTTHLDIPLQLQFKLDKVFSLLLGPQYSYLVSRRDEFGDGTITVAQEEQISRDNYRKNILGFVAGADIHLNALVLSGRAGWDITANHGDGTSSNPRYKNQWIQFTAGVAF